MCDCEADTVQGVEVGGGTSSSCGPLLMAHGIRSAWRGLQISCALLFVSLVFFIMLSGRCPRRAIGGYKIAY